MTDALGATDDRALVCRYEDVLGAQDVFSLLGLAAFYSRFFAQCSKAFVRLEGLADLPKVSPILYVLSGTRLEGPASPASNGIPALWVAYVGCVGACMGCGSVALSDMQSSLLHGQSLTPALDEVQFEVAGLPRAAGRAGHGHLS